MRGPRLRIFVTLVLSWNPKAAGGGFSNDKGPPVRLFSIELRERRGNIKRDKHGRRGFRGFSFFVSIIPFYVDRN